MTKEDLRKQAAISVLNSLLETTQHSVVECLALREAYAEVAVLYADALIDALDKPRFTPEQIADKFKNVLHIKS